MTLQTALKGSLHHANKKSLVKHWLFEKVTLTYFMRNTIYIQILLSFIHKMWLNILKQKL